ncbi:tetratricopeptide repeat protein [Sediminitomix flava]|uniref:Uncharacterized protein n=1 Tax=Sediminitomix flava TaxID=379075 RepID=A0A315ZA99_SEDFL|nr:hypothetical protein [Sediminitomix flava]PWJ42260.1 hypothetical protein BC781_103512 [Sediminitomix flava]
MGFIRIIQLTIIFFLLTQNAFSISIFQSDDISEDTLAFRVLIEEGEFYLSKDLDSTYYLTSQALQLVEGLDLPHLEIEANRLMGNYFMHKGEEEDALGYFLKSKSVAEENELPIEIAFANNNIGIVYLIKKELETASTYFSEAEKVLKSHSEESKVVLPKVQKTLIGLYNNQGIIYKKMNKPDQMIESLWHGLKLAEKTSYNELIAAFCNNIAAYYLNYSTQKDEERGFHYLERANKINTSIKNEKSILVSREILAQYYLNTQVWDSAFVYINQTKELANEIGANATLLRSLNYLNDYYASISDYKKAYETYNQYKILHDSLQQIQNKVEIERINEENKIRVAQEKRLLEQSRNEYRYAFFGVLTLCLLLLSAMILLAQKKKIRKDKVLKRDLRARNETL